MRHGAPHVRKPVGLAETYHGVRAVRKVSLEEVYSGCVKKMKVQRQVMNADGHTSMYVRTARHCHSFSGRFALYASRLDHCLSIYACVTFLVELSELDCA